MQCNLHQPYTIPRVLIKLGIIVSFCLLVFLQGTVTDTAGKVNLAVGSLSFSRVQYPLLAGQAYGILKSPGLLTLT